MAFDVYQAVTDAIIAKLEEGVIPWKKPWTGDAIQRNLTSKRPYRGINQFLLQVSRYSSPYWITFKACKAQGGKVRKGEKGTLVVFWKIMKFETDKINKDTGKREIKTVPLLRFYKVWNVEQCDGLKIPEATEIEFNPNEVCEQIIAEMPNPPEIKHIGVKAQYDPTLDRVTLPPKKSFNSIDGYYATAFHELVHSTGHEERLKRPGVMDLESYSKEELIAEMGSAMLCGVAQISPTTIDNAASYIANWIKRLKDDPKFVIQAGSKAQSAADYIRNVTFSEEPNGNGSI